MSSPVGRRIPLSMSRRLVVDFMHFADQIPTVTAERCLQLAPLAAARRACRNRPAWCILFARAFALVAARRPELRRTFVSFPRPHLYEHPISVAAVTIERRLGDEEIALVAQLQAPESQIITELDSHLRHCQTAPFHEIGSFRRTLRLARLPWPLRRLGMWAALKASGRLRARHVGTFGVTSIAAHGAGGLHLRSVLALTLHCGMFAADGSLDMRLTFDHRVLDGSPAARALADLEEVLLGEILEEVRGLPAVQAA